MNEEDILDRFLEIFKEDISRYFFKERAVEVATSAILKIKEEMKNE